MKTLDLEASTSYVLNTCRTQETSVKSRQYIRQVTDIKHFVSQTRNSHFEGLIKPTTLVGTFLWLCNANLIHSSFDTRPSNQPDNRCRRHSFLRNQCSDVVLFAVFYGSIRFFPFFSFHTKKIMTHLIGFI